MNFLNLYKNRKSVLGINERNLDYIKPYNSLKAIATADDKLRTKKALLAAQIPTPKLIGVINNYKELDTFNWDILPPSFVIKPVSGLEGGGIEIFFNRDKQGNWIKADGTKLNLDEIKGLATDIIDGKYSLHNEPDRVFFEERVKMHKNFQYYSFKGVPDIRVIVFNNTPIISYLRLPTKQSQGKGNLALGAIGAGIDIANGVTTSAIIGKSKKIEFIPGTKLNVSGLKIPYWDKILYYAVLASQATGLKFGGFDFLIDRELGPMIVEINARPGLSIQMANEDGLRWRLRKVKGLKVNTAEKGVRLGKDLFGGEVAEDIERISGKTLIGVYENVTVFPASDAGKKYKEVEVRAKIDTGADSSSLDSELANKLGYKSLIDDFNLITTDLANELAAVTSSEDSLKIAEIIRLRLKEKGYQDVDCNVIKSSHGVSVRPALPITIDLGGYKYETRVNIYDRASMNYKIIVGRKSLAHFLIEPSRKQAAV